MTMKKPIRACARGAAALLLAMAMLLPLGLSVSAVLPKRAVDYSEDFTDGAYADGVLIDNSALPLHEFWVVDQFANYAVAPCSYFVTDGDRTVLHIQSYVGILSASEMFDSYEYSVTMKLPKGHSGGVSVAARHAGGSVHGSLYEADYYRENGGNDANDRTGFLHDYSGIAVYPTAKTNGKGQTLFTVGIKCFEDRGKQRTYNQYFDVYLDVDTTKYFTVSFEDKDQTVTVKINDAVICSVEMSDPGTFADPTDGNEYYRRAVLKDAEGNTALEITDAKLAVNARIAIAARNSQCYISDISAYSENDVKVETQPPSEDTAPEEVTTETPVETTGEATEEATTEAPTESDGEESTAGESVTETDTPSAETDTQDRESPSDGGGIDVILLVIFGALEVVLMVVLTVLVKKRKGSAA